MLFCLREDIAMSQKKKVNSLEKVMIGGINQYVLERGDDDSLPLILFLHGGPGTAQIGFMPKYQSDLESHFIIVNWDQRGSGLSYSENIPKDTMSVKRFELDAVEVTNYLRKKYNKDKIFLIGHSWGSILGMKLIHQYPKLYKGYIGIGQVADMNEGEVLVYDFVKATAEAQKNEEALDELKTIEKPPYEKPLNSIGVIRKWVNEFDGVMKKGEFGSVVSEGMNNSDYYKEEDIKKWSQGASFSVVNLLDEMLTVNLFKEIKKVNVPVTFFAGRYDYTTPSLSAYKFYEMLEAPEKEFIWFEKSAHLPMIEEVDKFCDQVINIFAK